MQENINITVNGPELIIRHGDAPAIVPPQKYSVSGNITAPGEFFRTKNDRVGFTVESLLPMVVHVKRDGRRITFVGDPTNPLAFEVSGVLTPSSEYQTLGLNSGKEFTPADLAKLLKQNRHLFASQEEAMVVISDLMSFKADVNTKVIASNDSRGGRVNAVEVAANTNVPVSFLVNIPLFKGAAKQKLKVEIELDVRGSSVSCTLHSPDALLTMNETSDSIIDEQLKTFIEAGITVLEV